jgi:hypothetical protein
LNPDGQLPLREESPEPGVAGQAAATAKSDLELGIEALIRGMRL